MVRYFFTMILSLVVFSSIAKTYKVFDINEFNATVKNIHAGDSIILADTIWKDVSFRFKAEGTEESPVVLTVETPGKCIIEGESQLRMSGKYLIADGLVFINGHAPKGKATIDFRASSSEFAYNSIVRNCVIDHFNYPDKSVKDHWVEIWGKNNKVEYCYFAGKKNLGTTLVVWPNGEMHAPNYHHIYRNYFGYRPPLGINGGETIRVGTSDYSLLTSNTVIEENYFEHCNGETEIISNKSCGNKITNNTFFECEGSIVLRHGNNNEVSGNIMIGNKKPKTGGIRIINAGHKIFNNYLLSLGGDEFRSPLVVMNGVPNSPLNRYHKVKDVEVAYNTFIGCGTAWHLCLGSDKERTEIPENVFMHANVVYSPESDIVVKEYDNIKGFTFSNNMIVSRKGVYKEYGSKEAMYNELKTREGFWTIIPNIKENISDSLINKDINGRERNKEKAIGAFEIGSKSARRFVPNHINCGPQYKWDKKDPMTITTHVIKTRPGLNTLYDAVKKSSDGDIIELTDGNYINDKKINVNHNLVIIASPNATQKPVISINDNISNTVTMFELKEGVSLKIVGVEINGKEDNCRQAKYAVFIGGVNPDKHYNLSFENCNIYNFQQTDGSIISAQKNTFTDTISIVNTTMSNSFRGIALNREKGTGGMYNAEHIIIRNSTFRNINEWALHFYKENKSTNAYGGVLTIDHCLFDNVNNKTGQYMLKQTGLGKCNITNSLFMNSPNAKAIMNFDRNTYSISNCCLINAGKLSVKNGAKSSNIYYKPEDIIGNATDEGNIGLLD